MGDRLWGMGDGVWRMGEKWSKWDILRKWRGFRVVSVVSAKEYGTFNPKSRASVDGNVAVNLKSVASVEEHSASNLGSGHWVSAIATLNPRRGGSVERAGAVKIGSEVSAFGLRGAALHAEEFLCEDIGWKVE